MNSKRRPAILAQILRNVVRNSLRANENENFRVLRTYVVEVFDELAAFVKVSTDFDYLRDVVVRR